MFTLIGLGTGIAYLFSTLVVWAPGEFPATVAAAGLYFAFAYSTLGSGWTKIPPGHSQSYSEEIDGATGEPRRLVGPQVTMVAIQN